MAKTRMMVKQVLMSIVTLVSFVMAQYEDRGKYRQRTRRQLLLLFRSIDLSLGNHRLIRMTQ